MHSGNQGLSLSGIGPSKKNNRDEIPLTTFSYLITIKIKSILFILFFMFLVPEKLHTMGTDIQSFELNVRY